MDVINVEYLKLEVIQLWYTITIHQNLLNIYQLFHC